MKIESYSMGKIQIDGKEYTDDVLLFPDSVKDDWWREEGHSLSTKDLTEVLDADPDVVLVGTGAYGKLDVPQDVRDHLKSEGIELLVQKTSDACDTYNELKEKKKIIGAFHLTC